MSLKLLCILIDVANCFKYINNVRYTLGLRDGPINAGGKGKKGTIKVERLRNLNEPNDKPDEEDEVGTMMGPEMKFVDMLEKKHANCINVKCRGKVCKLNKYNRHIHLTHQQLRAWAIALVSFSPLCLFISLILAGCWHTSCYAR